MQTIVWVMKPHREARCKLCGNAALLPMDKPARAGGYICRRCRLAVIFGRIMEVVTTMVQTLIALDTVRIGDTVRVAHESLGVDYNLRMVMYIWDCLRGRYVSATFGDHPDNLGDTVSSTDIDLSILSDRVDNAVMVGRKYNKVYITHDQGFVAETTDGKSRTHMSATDGFVAEAQAGGKWAKVVITAGEPLSVYYDGKRIGGAGWVLFGLDPKPSCFEVFNDADGNLINLYRCIKYHCAELQRELEGLTASREMFFDYKNQLTGPGLTDIQRAARFYYLIRCSFGSSRRTFKTSQIVFSNRLSYLSEIQERLKRVTIENLDFAHLIRTYDRPDALFISTRPIGALKDITTPHSAWRIIEGCGTP